jgi:hypothetical protein
MNNISDDVYKEKYFKYKNKYINLKNNMNEDMVGGVNANKVEEGVEEGVKAEKVEVEIKAAKVEEGVKAKEVDEGGGVKADGSESINKDAEDAKVAKAAEDAKIAKAVLNIIEDAKVAKATINLIMDSIIKSMKTIKIEDIEYDFIYNKTNNIITFTYKNPQSGESSIFEFKIELKIIENNYNIIYTYINAQPSSSTPVVFTATFPSFAYLKPGFITSFFEPIRTYIMKNIKFITFLKIINISTFTYLNCEISCSINNNIITFNVVKEKEIEAKETKSKSYIFTLNNLYINNIISGTNIYLIEYENYTIDVFMHEYKDIRNKSRFVNLLIDTVCLKIRKDTYFK